MDVVGGHLLVLQPGVELPGRSAAAVALTSWRDELVLAWAGSDRRLDVARLGRAR